MPELLIMRHAKSDWGAGVAGDLDRPLAPRGVKAAERMGRFLSSIGSVPELVLSSPAVRARATAELAAEAGGWRAPIHSVDAFYGGDGSEVVKGIKAFESVVDRILVTGHEPTWSELVSLLTGGVRIAMPTGAVACVAFDGDDWSRLVPDCAELRWYVTPRMLKAVL